MLLSLSVHAPSALSRSGVLWTTRARWSTVATYIARTIRGMSQAPLLRGYLPPEIPDDVDDPAVLKASGVVRPPRHVNWSRPDPTYDLSDRSQRIRVNEQVLRERTATDVRHFIDIDGLIDLWTTWSCPGRSVTVWYQVYMSDEAFLKHAQNMNEAGFVNEAQQLLSQDRLLLLTPPTHPPTHRPRRWRNRWALKNWKALLV